MAINSTLKPDCVILDEAQRIKNWDTQTAQAVKRLQSRYVFVLTGTPLENRIDEIYSLMSILDPHVLGPLFRFNREFYVLNEQGRPEGYKNLQQLRERITPYLLRRRKADVQNELPDRTDTVISVAMAPEQRERYEIHEARVARLVTQARSRALTKPESDRLQRELSMMRMICDTPFILDETCRVCPKLDEIQNLLENALSTPGVKVLVFSEWERMLLLVQALCRQMAWDVALHTGSVPQQKRRQELVRFRSDPACRVFLSTDTGGVGLNLQQACVVINCDLPWSPARLEQRVARAWRKNQVCNVTVVNLVTEASIEARMVETLKQKRSLAQGVLDGESGLDVHPIGTGRQAFLQRLESFVHVPTVMPVPHASLEALRAVDPELGFAVAVLERLGNRLVMCEVCQAKQDVPVFLLVTEGNVSSALTSAGQAAAGWFSGSSRVPEIEVVDCSAYEAMKRFVKRGLLREPLCAGRTLYLRGQGFSKPALAPDSTRARAADLRRQASQAFQRARQLLERLSFDAARQPLEDSVVLLARAYAIQHVQDEPQDVRQAVSAAFAGLWGELRSGLGELLERDGSAVAVSRLLLTRFGG